MDLLYVEILCELLFCYATLVFSLRGQCDIDKMHISPFHSYLFM